MLLKVFHSDAIEEPYFWFYKEPFSQKFYEEPSISYLFIIRRTFFHNKEPFVQQKSTSDVKGSLWNHLDKKKFFYGIVKQLYF